VNPSRHSFAVGVVLVLVLLAAATATAALRGTGVRPLYDGFEPAPGYRWVHPPRFFAAGNVKPEPLHTTIPLGAGGSAATGVAAPDGQFVVNLAAGAVAPQAGARDVAVTITPVDPAGLARLAAPLRANGNAYRITMTYEPSGIAVTRLALPGTLVLTIPELGPQLFTSADGEGWTRIPAEAVQPQQLSLSANFATTGYYVGGTSLPELVTPGSGSSHGSLALGVATAAAAVVLVVGALVVTRRRPPPRPPA
jgi:hypothetical protein